MQSLSLAKEQEPTITFYRLIAQAREPMRADRAVGGTLPTRAVRYCEPVATASGFGWYVFPPTDFSILWDGSALSWTYAGTRDWYPLTSAQFPGFKQRFGESAPAHIAPFAPPFLTHDPHLQMLQIWSGYIARTKRDWSLLVRPVVNYAHTEHYRGYEAIIETDRWFRPLFTNIKLTKPNVPIHFRTDFPFLQVQALPRAIYSDAVLGDFTVVPDLASFGEREWACFEDTVVTPNVQQPRQLGRYASSVRKRRRQDVAA